MVSLMKFTRCIIVLAFGNMLSACVESNPKPIVYQCQKVWNKIDQKIQYECVDVRESTLDGPR